MNTNTRAENNTATKIGARAGEAQIRHLVDDWAEGSFRAAVDLTP